MLFGVDRCATQVVGGCGTGASEKNTHPAEVALYLRKPPSPQSQGWVSSLSGSAVAKKTPIPANGLLILLPTLTFGGGRGIRWAWSGIYGWVFFSLAPGSDLGFTLLFATLPLILGGGGRCKCKCKRAQGRCAKCKCTKCKCTTCKCTSVSVRVSVSVSKCERKCKCKLERKS